MSAFSSIINSLFKKKGVLDREFIDAHFSKWSVVTMCGSKLETMPAGNFLNENLLNEALDEYAFYLLAKSIIPKVNGTMYGGKMVAIEKKDIESLNIISNHFSVSTHTAEQYIKFLDKSDIELLNYKGGIKNDNKICS